MTEEVSGFRRFSYSLLKRQEAEFTKAGIRTLQISIIVFFFFFFLLFFFFFFVQMLFLLRKRTKFVPETDGGWKHKQTYHFHPI